jgi:hypothetical protein
LYEILNNCDREPINHPYWLLFLDIPFMKNKLSIWIIILLIGCSKSNDPRESLNLKFEDFELAKELNGKKYSYDSILNPRKILLKGDYIVVSTDGSSNLIHLILEKDMSYFQSKGVQGDGPGEINSIIWELDRGLDKNTFWAYDLNSKVFHEYDLESTNQNSLRAIKQRQDWYLGFSVHMMEPNRFISNVTRDNFKYGIFDSLGNRQDSFGPWSKGKVVDEKTGHLLLVLNQGQIEYNSTNQILAHSRILYELLEINSLETGNTISIYGPKNYEVAYEVFDSDGFPSAAVDSTIPNGYSDVFVGDKSVFAVYVGKTDALISSSGETSRTIFQFSLEGIPLSHFTTDFPIKSIAVDEEARKIYAVTEDKDPGIAVFDY